MLSPFIRKHRQTLLESAVEAKCPSPALMFPQSARALLSTPRRQKLLDQIWQRTALSRPQFNYLYRSPIDRFAELVQLLPASERNHHAYLGGMLDHGLEVVAYALKLRQSFLLPTGAQPEMQIAQAEAWTAGIAYAALARNLGKIDVDLHIEYADSSPWHPWQGTLTHPYRFRCRKDPPYRLHGAASGLIIHKLLKSEILDWLSTFPELWASLIFYWAGQTEHAGELGTLINLADQASVAQALGGDPTKVKAALTDPVIASPVETAPSSQFAPNTPSEADTTTVNVGRRENVSRSAATTAETASEDSLYSLESLLGGTPNLSEDFNSSLTADSAYSIEATPAPGETTKLSGEHFLAWLIEGVRSNHIVMNDTQALVHVAEDTLLLVTPGIFRRYAHEHPQIELIAKKVKQLGWEWIQKRFGEMNLYRKTMSNLNIWTYELSVAGKTRRLHGYLLNDHYGLVNDLAFNNPNLRMVEPSGEARPCTTLGNTR